MSKKSRQSCGMNEWVKCYGEREGERKELERKRKKSGRKGEKRKVRERDLIRKSCSSSIHVTPAAYSPNNSIYSLVLLQIQFVLRSWCIHIWLFHMHMYNEHVTRNNFVQGWEVIYYINRVIKSRATDQIMLNISHFKRK